MFWWDAGLAVRDREREAGGGGGGAKIRLGRTGPRGRMYSTTTKASSTPVIVKSKYIKAGKGARSAIREHVRYIQERERGEEERERKFFDREKEGLERKDVYDEMRLNQGRNVAMHTLILSPGDNKTDLQEYTRESMDALEDRLGYKLNWYAVTHENTDHYHSHVVVAGKIADRELELERVLGNRDERYQISDKTREELTPIWQREKEDIERILGKGANEREIEREPIDERDRDVIQDGRSADELKTERMLDRYERQQEIKEAARERGDVYLDRSDLAELRSAGTDYMVRERELDRELERAYEREFGRELDLDRDRELDRVLDRDLDRGLDREYERGYEREGMWDISQIFEQERQLELEPERSYERDYGDRGRERGEWERDDDEERERDRDRGDDFDRGR